MTSKGYTLDFSGYWREQYIGNLPAKSGIYCVYACTNNKNANTITIRKLLYIGESENIKARISGHERWNDWRRELRAGEELCFNSALIGPVSDRQRAEAATINHHKPPCNVEYVNNFPFNQTTVVTTGSNAKLDLAFTVIPSQKISGPGTTLLGGLHRF